MKVLYISDSHMKTKVIEYGLQLAQEHDVDNIILDTDIFDEWNKRDYGDYEEVINYLQTLQGDIENNKIIPILANHSYGYWINGGHTGYQKEAQEIVKNWLELNKDKIKLIYRVENYLFSHAGICNEWIQDFLQTSYTVELNDNLINKINNLWLNSDENTHKNLLYKNQLSPIWLRPTNTRLYLTYPNNFIQITGHTPVDTPKILSCDNCEIYLVDTHSLYSDLTNVGDESYLLIDTEQTENKQIKIITKI